MNTPSFDTLEPIYFFPLFIGMWVFVTSLLAFLSGWMGLSARFQAADQIQGERFSFKSGSMGAIPLFRIRYANCLFVTVGEQGFRLSILFLFRLLSPPLFIPWREVESVKEKQVLFMRRVEIRIRGASPKIMFTGAVGQAILKQYNNSRGLYAL